MYTLIIYIFIKTRTIIQANFEFLGHNFANRIVKNCNIISRFFKTSHRAKFFLEKYTKEFNIEGNGLRSYTPTRWTSMFETTDAVRCLKQPLEKVKFI